MAQILEEVEQVGGRCHPGRLGQREGWGCGSAKWRRVCASLSGSPGWGWVNVWVEVAAAHGSVNRACLQLGMEAS